MNILGGYTVRIHDLVEWGDLRIVVSQVRDIGQGREIRGHIVGFSTLSDWIPQVSVIPRREGWTRTAGTHRAYTGEA